MLYFDVLQQVSRFVLRRPNLSGDAILQLKAEESC